MVNVSNTGSKDYDDERVRGLILFYLYERRQEGRISINQIQQRIAAMHPDIVELDFRDLFLDNDWVNFSGSDGTASITESGIREVERRVREGRII